MSGAIIFGSGGQDGYYLSRLLGGRGYEVMGIGRPGGKEAVNLADYESVKQVIREKRPKYIFHLAANSTTSHQAWKENHEVIATGSLNIMESVRECSPETKVFLSGSGLQFINKGFPINETNSFEASSSYAVSRIQSVYSARYYRSLGVRTYIGYLFNHDSPRRSDRHVSKKITNTVRHIKAGIDEKIEIGDTSVRKEWGFADDIVKGIWTLVQQEDVFETVVGTGLAYSIEEWLEVCFSFIHKRWQDYVMPVENFRPEYQTLVSDPSLINSLGWSPETSFEQLARLMIEA